MTKKILSLLLVLVASTASAEYLFRVNSAGLRSNFPLTETQFNQIFPSRNPLYTYQGLRNAMSTYPDLFTQGGTLLQTQEVAAFLANVEQETGGLQYVRELNTENYPLYCQTDAVYSCAPGQQYYGRGALQLSWNYNYGPAGQSMGLDLLADPDLVARDGNVAWKTALWFWSTQAGGAATSPHASILGQKGFGKTIRAINGALECNQPAGSYGYTQMQNRVNYFIEITTLLGVPAGSGLAC